MRHVGIVGKKLLRLLLGFFVLALASAGCTTLTMMTLPRPHSSENCGQM